MGHYLMDMNTTRENVDNRDIVAKEWNLGPEKTAGDNTVYWEKMGKIWSVTPQVAKRQLCANCEYYDNTPDMMKQMLNINEDKYDVDGGGRGYCHKFDFICHNLRTCQAWEEKDYYCEEAKMKPAKMNGLGDDDFMTKMGK